jgi:hypothetical protein
MILKRRNTNKYMKKWSIALAIKEMHIKTTLRFHLIPVRMVIINNANKQQMLARVQEKRNPSTLLVGM